MEMDEKRKFALMLAASYAAALSPLAAIVAHAGTDLELFSQLAELFLLTAPAAWTLLLLLGILQFGLKALWMLLGAPFAFFIVALIGI
jgi:hypothetical protein